MIKKSRKIIQLEAIKQNSFSINDFYIKPKILVVNSECPKFYILTRLIKEYAEKNPEKFLEKIDSIVFEVQSKDGLYQIEVFKNGKVVYAPANTTLTILDVIIILNGIYYNLYGDKR